MSALSYSFVQRALMAGLVMASFLPLLSVFVVGGRMAFVGVGLSHSAFAGLALGALVGVDPVLGALVVVPLVGLVLAHASRKGSPPDTATGVLFAGAMALGATLLALSGGTRVDLWTYLFGNILSVSWGDLAYLAGVAALVLLSAGLLWRPLVLTTLDRELARAQGIRVDIVSFFFLFLMSLSVVVCLRAVGIVLLSGLLVFPGAVASRLAKSLRAAIALSYLTGGGAIMLGFGVSLALGLPSGASIILIGTLIYLITLLF